jgi:hypothetical protein
MSMSPSESEPEQITKDTVAGETMEREQPKHGFGHTLLFYILNRVLDVFDFVRVRVRLGTAVCPLIMLKAITLFGTRS